MQPWGRDGDKRRYWLIEGQDDTHFRLYRESNPILRHNTWRSVAGSIDEVKEVADRLGEESSLLSRRLRDRIIAAIPRFEASEEVCPPYVAYGWRKDPNSPIETKTSRLPSGSKGSIHASRTWIFPLRRPHPWEAYKVYLFGG